MWFNRNGHHEEPALVLSGGGAMGALQAGILRVLTRRGFRPSRIVGTSVGALNAAFLAFHPGETGGEMLVNVWRSLQDEHYLRINPVRVALRIASRKLYLVNNDFLQKLIAEHIVIDDFSSTEVPLYIAATNLATGRKHVFNEGSVSQAVLASSAIPGIFSPVEIEGDFYVDGGVTANLDLETAVEAGAKQILAIDLSHCFEVPDPSNVMDVVTRTVEIVLRERVEQDVRRLGEKTEIALLQPRIESGPGVGDLSQASSLLEQGEAYAERIFDKCFDGKGRLQPGTFAEDLSIPAVDAVSD
ncbi:MAG: patatin-like phospholipase family protein [Chloroflexi bacterium]|nr:patatin-like phospholipase family protein [Chloroflexota bacterium]